MLRIGQVESSATVDGKYTDGSVAGGIAATRLRAAAFNAMQEELAHIVESTDVALDVDDTTQVLVALQKIFAGNSDSLGALAALVGAANKLPYFTGPKAAALADLTAFAREILAQTDAAGVLTKLGLGELVLAGTMTGVFDTNGYITIPAIIGGDKRTLIIQWGQGNNAASATSQTSYPIPFPSKTFQVVASGYQVAGNVQAYVTLNGTGRTDYFTWQAFYANGGAAPALASIAGQVMCRYFAIGW